jgi:hypothetical protein
VHRTSHTQEDLATLRNTRQTFTIRISDAERIRIARAATRLGKPLTSFVREAALAVSARVEKKVVAKEKPPPERELHIIEPRTDHHFVDGVCMRCWRDEDDVGDLPCTPPWDSERPALTAIRGLSAHPPLRAGWVPSSTCGRPQRDAQAPSSAAR